MKERKPDMRFKGYEDSWIEKPFGEVFDTLSNNTLSRDKLNYDAGSIMDVHYGDILIKFGEILDTEKEGLPFITNDADAEKYQAAFLRDGDIVVADTAEDETVGKCTEICNVGDKKILSGLHTIPYRSKDGFATGFLGYYLNSGKYHDKLLPVMQGVKVTSISKSGLNETNVIYPKSKKEQALIGGFLFALDEKINSESIVCEKLKILKKAMLGKMFPSNGSRIPEIRFSGFTEPWEQRKLSLICDFEKGKGLNKDDIVDDGIYPCILYGQLFTEYGMFINEVQSRSNTIGNDYKLSEKGDILIPRCDTTPDGLGRASSLDLDNVILGFDINILKIRDKQKYDSKFISVALNHHKKELLSKVVGSTVRHLENKELKDISIEHPCSIKEQQMIGSLFQQLENAITLHQQKVGKLINIKSACMRRLFV